LTSNHAVTDAENTFVKAEPVIAAHAAAAILGYVGTLLVTHGVITHDQASALTQQVLPAVVAGLLVLFGVVVRRFVAPAALFAQRVEDEVQKRLEAATGLPARSTTAALPVTTTITTGTTGGYALLPNGPYVTATPAAPPTPAPSVDDPIVTSPTDFLGADAEVPAATEPAESSALPADSAGAHAADPTPPA